MTTFSETTLPVAPTAGTPTDRAAPVSNMGSLYGSLQDRRAVRSHEQLVPQRHDNPLKTDHMRPPWKLRARNGVEIAMVMGATLLVFVFGMKGEGMRGGDVATAAAAAAANSLGQGETLAEVSATFICCHGMFFFLTRHHSTSPALSQPIILSLFGRSQGSGLHPVCSIPACCSKHVTLSHCSQQCRRSLPHSLFDPPSHCRLFYQQSTATYD